MFRFVQWEDIISFHARLFRCFLLGILDAHGELAVLSHGSKWMLAVLGQRLADTGLMHDAGHLHDSVSDRVFPPGRHNGVPMQCPPKRKHEATSMLSFAVNSPMDQTMPVPPLVSPQPINITHGLYDELAPPTVAFDLPGSGRVLGGYDGPPTGVVGFILLWVLTLAIVVSRCSSTGSGSFRVVYRSPLVAVESTTNLRERAIRSLPYGGLPINEATQRVVACTPEDVDHQVSMPGAWLHERQEQNMLEESVFNTMSWTLFYSCAHMRMQACISFPGLTAIFASDIWNRGSNNMVTIGRRSEDGCSTVCRGLGLNKLDLDAGVETPATLGKTEHGATQEHLPIESCLAIRNRGSITTMHNRRCEPIAINNVAPMGRDPTRTTTLEVVCGDKVGLTFRLVGSSNVDHFLCQEDTTPDVDDIGSEDRYDGTEDEGLFGVSTHLANISQLEGKNGYRVLGRRQDGTLSDTGCPPSLRRVRSTGHLGRKHDIFDDDGGASDDSYWMEQVNARLSGERDPRRTSCRYGWSDVTSWPREGREDETDNWRTRCSQVTQFSAPKKTIDAGQCQGNSDGIKLRRCSSPPLNVDASHSHRAGSGDGPQGIYVVPQKRGRTMGGRCWSPESSSRTSNRPSGLDFLPFRKTPSLLTPKAWRPGCLYVPDPPVDEARQADAWWDSLSSVGGCGNASGVGHGCGFGTTNRDSSDQGASFSQDAPDAPVSWRNRHENNPASRRFASVHRRAMTEG